MMSRVLLGDVKSVNNPRMLSLSTALFKPTGEPVLELDSKKKASLRKFTLSGKYQVMTRPQDQASRIALATASAAVEAQNDVTPSDAATTAEVTVTANNRL